MRGIMKKTIGICLFAGFLALFATVSFVWIYKSSGKESKTELAAAETETEEPPASREIMSIKEPYEYIIHEKDGFLVVYESDGKTLLFETNIRTAKLDASVLERLEKGIPITDEAELYAFLESYSS